MSLRDDLWRDDLSQLEVTPPLMVSPTAPVREAVEIMRSEGKGCILVCEGSELRGIFTERDLVKRVLAAGSDLSTPLSDFMTPDPVTARRTDSVGAVIRTMYRGRYRHLPVIDDRGRAVGTVSVKRVVQYLVDHVSSSVYNLPPKPRQVQTTREGA